MDKSKRAAIIAGNWKMNKTQAEAKELISGLLPAVKDAKCTVIIGVPFTTAVGPFLVDISIIELPKAYQKPRP